MPPSAAPEWLRVGWSFEIIATSAPASCAAIAARIPAQPAPTTRTSCFASTAKDPTETPRGSALLQEARMGEIEGATPDQRRVLLEILGGMGRRRIEGLGVEPYEPLSEELQPVAVPG